MGGLELVERIRRTNPELRILIVSGYSEFEYARRAIELGVEDYVLKPIDLEKLREILRRIRIRLEASAGAVDAEFGLGPAAPGKRSWRNPWRCTSRRTTDGRIPWNGWLPSSDASRPTS